MKYLRIYIAAHPGVVFSQLEITTVGPQKEGHLLEGQHHCLEGEEEEVQPGRAVTQPQNVVPLQHRP